MSVEGAAVKPEYRRSRAVDVALQERDRWAEVAKVLAVAGRVLADLSEKDRMGFTPPYDEWRAAYEAMRSALAAYRALAGENER